MSSLLCCTVCVGPAGTLSGNPLAMTAGIKTLEILDRPGSYEHLDKVTSRCGGAEDDSRASDNDVRVHAEALLSRAEL